MTEMPGVLIYVVHLSAHSWTLRKEYVMKPKNAMPLDAGEGSSYSPEACQPSISNAAVQVNQKVQGVYAHHDWHSVQARLVQHGFLTPEDACQDLFGDTVTSPTLINAIERVYASGGLDRRFDDRLHWWDIAGAIEALESRFCGVDDQQAGGPQTLSFGSPIGRWGKSALTFSINTAGCNLPNAAPLIAGAFAQWQAASRGRLAFTQVPSGGDLQVNFGGASLDQNFGKLGGVAGSAFPPSSGAIRLDSAETWSANTPPPLGQVSLLAIALHEIGHALGLAHSDNPGSIMYPYAPALATIDAESVGAIQSIYGWLPQRWLSDRGTSDRPALGVTSTYTFTSRSDTAYMV